MVHACRNRETWAAMKSSSAKEPDRGLLCRKGGAPRSLSRRDHGQCVYSAWQWVSGTERLSGERSGKGEENVETVGGSKTRVGGRFCAGVKEHVTVSHHGSCPEGPLLGPSRVTIQEKFPTIPSFFLREGIP